MASAHAAKNDVITTLLTLGSFAAALSSCKLDLMVSSIIDWLCGNVGDAINILQNTIEGIRSVNVGHLDKFEFGAEICLHPDIAGDRRNSTTYTVAALQENFNGDAGNIALVELTPWLVNQVGIRSTRDSDANDNGN